MGGVSPVSALAALKCVVLPLTGPSEALCLHYNFFSKRNVRTFLSSIVTVDAYNTLYRFSGHVMHALLPFTRATNPPIRDCGPSFLRTCTRNRGRGTSEGLGESIVSKNLDSPF